MMNCGTGAEAWSWSDATGTQPGRHRDATGTPPARGPIKEPELQSKNRIFCELNNCRFQSSPVQKSSVRETTFCTREKDGTQRNGGKRPRTGWTPPSVGGRDDPAAMPNHTKDATLGSGI